MEKITPEIFGAPEVLSVATTKTLLGLTGTNSGDVTLAGTRDYIRISGQEITRGQVDLANDVTGDLPLSNLAQSAAYSVLGRSTGTVGDVADIVAGNQSVLRRYNTGNVEFGAVEGAMISAGTIGLSHLENISGNVLIGRDGLAGTPEEISLSAELQFSGSNTLRIAASGVTDAMFRTAAGVSVVGRSINSAGVNGP